MKAIRNLMREGVQEGVFPGVVTLAAREGKISFLEACGLARLAPARPMKTDTVFDLASLTKPLATAVSVMQLVQEGRLRLDETLGEAIPDFSGTDKASITIRQLLSHTAGLPEYRPYYKMLSEVPSHQRENLLKRWLLHEDLVQRPGTACLYGDPGFMILGWLIEVATGKSLDRFVDASVYGPLELTDLFFVSLEESAHVRHRSDCAATEDCPWRGRTMEGEVHDENAYALGGVAGHAGLFGTAQQVHTLLHELWKAYHGENGVLFQGDVVQTFFRQHGPMGSWALGFDTPTRPDSSSGQYFSDTSVGHLGFTGTSFWMDLERGATVLLFTNRVHPTRRNEKIKHFRPLLHDAVMKAMGFSTPV